MLAATRPSYLLALRTNHWAAHENPKYRLTKVKRALFIEHDHVTLSGPLWRAFKNRGYEVVRMPVVKAENFETPNVQVDWPDFSEYDVIVPMGSPWGVWEDERIGNWLLPELERVTASHNAGQPIFGVCFGGQLMARALGGSVSRAPRSEIGWHYVMTDYPEIIPNGPWFQYHWDRFTVPPGATELARSPIAPQAFVMGRTLGLQFHPEIDLEVLDCWLEMDGGPEEIEGEGLDVEILRQQTKAEEAGANARAQALVDYFLDHIATAEIKRVS